MGSGSPMRRRSRRREELPPRRVRQAGADGILAAMLARSDLSDPRPTWRERLLEVPEDLTRSAWYGRWAAFLLLAIWGTAVVLGRMTDPPALLHLTVILFHE